MTDPRHHPPAFANAPGPGWRRWRALWLALLFAGLSAAGIWAVYAQVAGHEIRWDPRLLGARTVLASLALLLVYFAADGLRLWFTLRALGQTIAFADLARLVMLNIYISNITPMATGGGVAQVWFMHRRGVPVGVGLAATTLRTALAAAFIFAGTPAFLLMLPQAQSVAENNALLLTLGVLVALYVAFFVVLIMRTRWLLQPTLAALKGLQRLHLIRPARYRRWRWQAARALLQFAHGFGQYIRGARLDVAASLVCTVVFLLALFSFPVLLFQSLGYSYDYWLVIGRMVVTTFVMYFSPTPGASGVAEGVFAYFFRDVVTASHLVLVTLAWRVLTTYLGMLIGVFVLQREIAAERRQPA